MDNPPPVPPKDTPYRTSFMDADRPISTPASGSKRKREASDSQLYNFPSGQSEAPDADAHTPKRSRPHLQPSYNSASDDATPVQQRNVRRKKGVNNLSNLNLRHAAERQAQLQAEGQSQLVPRESRFQEGSLTDRPSDQPPSAFTRVPRTDSGNLSQVDDLMDDYHNGMPTPRKTVEIEYAREQAQIPQQTAATTPQPAGTENNHGFFYRFGRQIAASFHPVRLWKEVWDDTYEELRLKNIAEFERKRALKEEAERRYAQMKADGQFGGRTISRASAASNVTTRDSGVILSGGMPSEHKRDVSYDSQATTQVNNASIRSENEPYDPTASVVKTLKSRLTFKRPSLQNLQFGIKRTKSDFNLAAAASAQRDTSSSASPTKAEFGDSALRKSKSKIDIRRQHKLSKRVSDLETKLNRARSELDSALSEASPMSKGNNYQRFTPYSSLRRPKFVPGKLESLPSERLLDPSQFNFELDEVDQVMQHRAKAAADLEGGSSEPSKAIDLMDTTDENDEETIRMSRARPYPPRASSIFNLNNENIEDVTQDKISNTNHDTTAGADDMTQSEDKNDKMDVDKNPTIEVTQPENESENAGTEMTRDQSKPAKATSYANLDAKLKALDANVKLAAKKPPKSKKRKSGDKEDLKDYRPGDDDEDDEDAEWDKIGVRPKRRKSSGVTKKKTARKSAGASEDVTAVDDQAEAEATKSTGLKVEETNNEIEEVPIERPGRASLDSQHAILEPVLEEENEESAAITGDPVKKPNPKSTHSRDPSMEAGAEQELMTRAAAAARKHRSHSPPGGDKTSLGDTIHVAAKQPALADNVTKRSRSRSAKKGKKSVDEKFEWPEDVF